MNLLDLIEEIEEKMFLDDNVFIFLRKVILGLGEFTRLDLLVM